MYANSNFDADADPNTDNNNNNITNVHANIDTIECRQLYSQATAFALDQRCLGWGCVEGV